MVAREQRSLADLLVSALQAREQEGARVSRFLHDEVGQVLSAIGLQLDLLRMDLEDNVADCSQRIVEVQKVLESAVAQVRDLSYELNPSIVERTGLKLSLDRLIGRYQKDFPGAMRLQYDSSVRLPVEVATAMYKISEQAVENAVEHSGADHVDVIVKMGRQGVTLEVRDDGSGFSTDRKELENKGLGLHLMQHHAAQAGLRVSVASTPSQGTIVRVIFRPGRVAPSI
jgi:signal transduction histidine kinase